MPSFTMSLATSGGTASAALESEPNGSAFFVKGLSNFAIEPVVDLLGKVRMLLSSPWPPRALQSAVAISGSQDP